jgi:dipeptidyl aminopeptidase/acylaminoacyl peptidase
MRTMRFGSTWLSVLGGGLLAAGCVGAAPEGETSAELRPMGAWSAPVHVTSLPVGTDCDGTISTAKNDQRPTFSKDGLSLYFSSNRLGAVGSGPPFEGTDLFVSQRASVNDAWGTPVKLDVLNSAGDDNAPAFSPDGHYIYFGSTRPGYCGPSVNFDLWVAHRQDASDDFGWEEPVHVGCDTNSIFNDDGPTYATDENGTAGLYFTSTRLTNNVEWDIFFAPIDPDDYGHVNFGAATKVNELSSPKRDTRTSLSHDGLEMYITSNRATSAVQLYRSTRASTADAWSTPVLVPELNSGLQDGAPSLSFDGSTIYFDSTRPGSVGPADGCPDLADGGRDIWMSTRAPLRGN